MIDINIITSDGGEVGVWAINLKLTLIHIAAAKRYRGPTKIHKNMYFVRIELDPWSKLEEAVCIWWYIIASLEVEPHSIVLVCMVFFGVVMVTLYNTKIVKENDEIGCVHSSLLGIVWYCTIPIILFRSSHKLYRYTSEGALMIISPCRHPLHLRLPQTFRHRCIHKIPRFNSPRACSSP